MVRDIGTVLYSNVRIERAFAPLCVVGLIELLRVWPTGRCGDRPQGPGALAQDRYEEREQGD